MSEPDDSDPIEKVRADLAEAGIDTSKAFARVKAAVDAARRAEAATFRVIYTWDDGREEVRYERPWPSPEADEIAAEVATLHKRAKAGGYHSPYSTRVVTAGTPAVSTPQDHCRD